MSITPETPPKTQWIAVDIQSFRDRTRDVNFDVYLKLSDTNYAHIFSRTTGLDYKRLSHYIQQGVSELFIRPQDEALYKEFTSKTARSIFLDPKAPHEKKIAAILNMTEQSISEIFSSVSVPEKAAQSAQTLVESYVHMMSDEPESLALILKLVSHGEYLYYHSVAVSIFSILLARASGEFKDKDIERIGMGGFLHDIGHAQMSGEWMDSSDLLTHEERKKVEEHPRLGLQMIETTPGISKEVQAIIYQHHEQPSGQGYPNNLLDRAISNPAKIVAIADAFCALISERPYQKSCTIAEAVRKLETQQGRHDKNYLKLLRAVFLQKVQKAKAA